MRAVRGLYLRSGVRFGRRQRSGEMDGDGNWGFGEVDWNLSGFELWWRNGDIVMVRVGDRGGVG